MYLKEVVIDGFKSYAHRVVVGEFDPHFNAITGRNGSGKSNILDAICFVLGITNLSQVRASSLGELVYKQGQTGVTKATVALVFDNSDAAGSPVGYEHCKEITVTRQVVIGGRNKYLINGVAAQQNRVQNLFHSVQLNVNNPHFLIMQGRITKVLNMKPDEILGMLAETAGTRMYQQKKQQAEATIEKKASKVAEIDEILVKEITPALEKHRAEREQYMRWSSNQQELDRLTRFCVAYKFTELLAAASSSDQEKLQMQAELQELTSRIESLKATIAEKEAALQANAGKVQQKMDAALAAAQEADIAADQHLVKTETMLSNKKVALADETAALQALRNQLTDLAKSKTAVNAKLQSLQATMAQQETALVEARNELATLQRQFHAVAAGVSTEDQASIADQLKAALRTKSEMVSTQQTQQLIADSAQSELATVKSQLSKTRAEQDAVQKELESYTEAVTTATAARDRLRFNPDTVAALKSRKTELEAQVSKLSDEVDSIQAKVDARLRFEYNESKVARALRADWDASKVHGVVAKLVRVKKASNAGALEVAAGGKLYQIVVQDEQIGSALLKHGDLRKRVTIIPLTKVKAPVLSSDVIRQASAAAAQVSRDAWAVPALSLVGGDDSVRKALEYVFGRHIVCSDSETAKRVAFGPTRTNAVTLEGDSYDPRGILEGGSKPEGAGILTQLEELHSMEDSLNEARAHLQTTVSELDALSRNGQKYADLDREVQLATHKLELARQRLSHSRSGQLQSRLEELQSQLQTARTSIANAQSSLVDLERDIARLQHESQNVEAARASALSSVENKMNEAKRRVATATEKAAAAREKVDEQTLELQRIDEESANLQAQEQTAAASVASLTTKVAELTEERDAAAERHAETDRELKAQQAQVAARNKTMQGLMAEKDGAAKEVGTCDIALRKLQHKLERFNKDMETAGRSLTALVTQHPWIEKEKQFFGKPHTDFDFEARNPEAAAKRHAQLEAQQAKLSKNLNKKVIGMIESAEKEYQELMTKKRIIETDKAKIEAVIRELDEKKNEALMRTYERVNRDFGSIFSTLLPGTTGKLVPVEGMSVLDGLEVKVAFNGVWKESLTELSGGQRSLLALSLILALLLFKPAPMYILDEVDAALDLSHTQNIGHMLRTHFSHSQFIVVSLKQGMFNNANVLFKTRFVDGVSGVIRTVPAGSRLLQGGGAAGAAAGAADVDEDEVAENEVVARPAKSSRAAGAASRTAFASRS